MTAMFLEPAEIQALTNRQRYKAQRRVLNEMGIESRPRADGSLAVLRSHVEAELGGAPGRQKNQSDEPNWDAVVNN